MKEYNESQNNDSLQDVLDGKCPRYFGVSVKKMIKGDYSIGACISYDGWFGECYLFLNLIKWTVTIAMMVW